MAVTRSMAVLGGVLGILAVALLALVHHFGREGGPRGLALQGDRPAVPSSPAPMVETVELGAAVSAGRLAAWAHARSRNALELRLRALGPGFVEVVVPLGAVFERGGEQLVVARQRRILLAPATETSHVVITLSATGVFSGPGEFHLAGGRVSSLAVLLPYAESRPEIPMDVLQTAALVLTENLPLSAFARFELVAGDSPAVPEAEDLKVDNRTIIRALRLLKETGVPMERVALNIDPQLLVETMTDPLAHAEALEFYEIPPGREWEFWKAYLEYGDAATRHYALHGMGRFFPDVAVDMMGDWARSSHLDESLRVSAVQALARTGRMEALSVLARLQGELASDAAMEAAIQQSTALLVQAIYDPFHLALPAEYKLTQPDLRGESAESPPPNESSRHGGGAAAQAWLPHGGEEASSQ